ncbi:hypothetical protein DSM106972_093830 [Dulcicalothrix desertica PCC 7102]|uniref:NB-ARC domain-containing protein n=1 Tax=Dulcicalothrix desertica PCC 7102 TaxID=232991 RepID=A0A3S5K2X5_9CYAN|nr:NB-ARC domain-containing protein [Dulcicalothrix desertica]RUS94398.1 hypothetical protein DSM106972_093830 [Dulcicalothrix desertica PCC 7102]TWH54975.1 NB-ARC domain-containing protein [Dulcicalothrix desertica PCC 7102]
MKEFKQQKRRRGVILTNQGLKRLQAATSESEIQDNYGIRYTLNTLSERTCLDPHTLVKIYTCKARVDKRTLSTCFEAFNISLAPTDYYQPSDSEAAWCPSEDSGKQHSMRKLDWGEVPDVSVFYGRTLELVTLEQFIIEDNCRLVTLLGMGGIGKTYLCVKLAHKIQDKFEFVIYKSFASGLSFKDMLTELIQFLSNGHEASLPENVDALISRLIHYLRVNRCLLVLDDVETILQNASASDDSGCYCEGYEAYGKLFKRVGEVPHQSCLILIGREKPKGIGQMTGDTLPVRSLILKGLQVLEIQKIFQAKGFFIGSPHEWEKLVNFYAGNPLALNIASTTIQKLFDGYIAKFLNQRTLVFGEIYDLIREHVNRLSNTEKQVIEWLASNHPASFSQIQKSVLPLVSPQKLLEALECLQERCLIDKALHISIEERDYLFTLPLVVKEFVTEKLIKYNAEKNGSIVSYSNLA